MTDMVKATTTQEIKDAGTGAYYEAKKEYEFEAGVFQNYAAAGLVVASAAAPASAPAAAVKDASTDTTKAKV